MLDKVMALGSLCGLIVFLSVLVVFVPDPDLIIVMTLVAAFALYDFYAAIFRRGGGQQGLACCGPSGPVAAHRVHSPTKLPIRAVAMAHRLTPRAASMCGRTRVTAA